MAGYIPILDKIIELEGGYILTEHTGDKGGQTYAGISRAANGDWVGWDVIDRDGGIDKNPEKLKKMVADLYEERYWKPLKCDHIASKEVARTIFSAGVLSGVSTSARLTQMTLGLEADGVIGSVTIERLAKIKTGTAEEALFEARFALARIARYSRIVEKDQSQAKWLRGWINRAIKDAK